MLMSLDSGCLTKRVGKGGVIVFVIFLHASKRADKEKERRNRRGTGGPLLGGMRRSELSAGLLECHGR